MSVPNPFKSPLDDVNLSNSTQTIFSDPSVQKELEGEQFLSTSATEIEQGVIGGGVNREQTNRSSKQEANTTTSSITSRCCGFLSIDYYRPYFDVSQDEVANRMKQAFLPWKNEFFEKLDSKPDFYGPVWICTTLVFFIAATSNLSLWFAFHGKEGESFQSDFRLLTFAATMVYGCGVAMPVLAWGSLQYTGITGFNLPNIICVYGYSILPYLPASVLCSIPNQEFQIFVVMVAFGFSATFLLRNLWSEISAHILPQLSSDSSTEGRKRAMLTLAGLVGLHLVFSIILKMYFFGNSFIEVTTVTEAPTEVPN